MRGPEERGEPTGPAPDGRERLRRAVRRPGSRGQVVAGLLLAVLGFGAVAQVQSNDAEDAYVGARQGEIIALIDSLSLASDRARAEIDQLERTREALLDDTQVRLTALREARTRADQLGILAGTLEATGPGVRVTVEDSSGAVGSAVLINGIQELRDAGAEAIEINDTVRVVAQTSLRDTGTGEILTGGQRISGPYTIDAIGAPRTLAGALEIARGFTDEVEGAGGRVEVQQSPDIDVATTREPSPPVYSEPVPTE